MLFHKILKLMFFWRYRFLEFLQLFLSRKNILFESLKVRSQHILRGTSTIHQKSESRKWGGDLRILTLMSSDMMSSVENRKGRYATIKLPAPAILIHRTGLLDWSSKLLCPYNVLEKRGRATVKTVSMDFRKAVLVLFLVHCTPHFLPFHVLYCTLVYQYLPLEIASTLRLLPPLGYMQSSLFYPSNCLRRPLVAG